MAGRVAKDTNAKVLLLNHISSSNDRQSAINDLVESAETSNGGGSQVAVAYDFMEFQVPRRGFDF